MKFTNKAYGAMGYFLALSSLKFPLGFKVFLNVIPLVLGAVYLSFGNTKNFKKFYPLLLMLMLNFYSLFLAQSGIVHYFRLIQVVLLIGFSLLIAECWKVLKDSESYSKATTLLAVLFLILEIIFIGPDGMKDYFGLKIPRYMGFLGESNFSAVIIAFNSLLLRRMKKFKWVGVNIVVLILLASRSGISILMMHEILYQFNHYLWKYKKSLWFLLICFLFTPVIILGLYHWGSSDLIRWIENFSSGRFFLYYPYVKMGLDHPIGVGYFNGLLNYQEYLNPILEIAESYRKHQINEQHNIFIQVFSEFGPIGYFFFGIQLIILFKEALKTSYYPLFISLLVGFSFLNGLNEYILYMTIGFILSGQVVHSPRLERILGRLSLQRKVAGNNV